MANIGYIQVNRYCNNACHFCSNPSNGQSISFEEGKALIDDFVKKDYQGVIFTGGEPTLSSDLPNWIAHACSVGLNSRVISNGMMCASYEYTKKLSDAGLRLIHFSVYSYNPLVHDFLTDTPGSWKRVMNAIKNALSLGIRVQINITINHYNQSHLDTTAKFLTKQFPKIQHFIWNNLDPLMMRKTETALSTLPDFQAFEAPLHRALTYLRETGRTFRVERVPLCYMRGFEDASTETRKIVKDEERIVHFLDNRKSIQQKSDWFQHDKSPECDTCDLSSICGGIWLAKPATILGEEHPGYYQSIKYRPQKLTKIEKEEIIQRITH